MTTNEIIYSVREALRRYTQDSTVDNREILFQVNLQRSLYYRNEFNKTQRSIDEDVKQTLCLELEVTTAAACGCSDSCNYLVTKKAIPPMLELHNGPALSRITSIDQLQIPFNYVKFTQLPFTGNGRYNKQMLFVSRLPDNKLIFKSNNPQVTLLSHVFVTAVFENPKELENYCDNNNVPCFDDDKPYPMKQHVLAYIMEPVINYFIAKLNIPRDNANNANDA